jgi:hypothetical protein
MRWSPLDGLRDNNLKQFRNKIKKIICKHKYERLGIISNRYIDYNCIKCNKQKLVDLGKW